MQDPQREHVVAALLGVLAPVQGSLGIRKDVVGADHHDLADLSQKPVIDHFADVIVLHEPEGAGDDLLDQVGILMSGLQHPVRLFRVARHPGFRENVFPGCQRRTGDLAVKVGPGADADGIDLRIGDQFVPARKSLRDAEFFRSAGRRFGRAIGDPDKLDVRKSAETGHVSLARIFACADDSDPHALLSHRILPLFRRVQRF